MTGPEGNSEILFPGESQSFRDEVERDKIHCPIAKHKKKKFEKSADIPATSGHLRSRATAVNILRITVNCFPFDVIVFTMLPVHGIWRETVSLLDVMLTNGAL